MNIFVLFAFLLSSREPQGEWRTLHEVVLGKDWKNGSMQFIYDGISFERDDVVVYF